MSYNSVAKRYATALFQLAKEKNIIEQVEEDLRVVRKVLSENPSFLELLKSPRLSPGDKKTLIKETFHSVSLYVLNVMMILTDRHREEHMISIVDAYVKLANEEKGIEDAVVYSYRALTEMESKAVSAAFAAKIGKKALNIENVIDTDLLGGMKIVIGNRIYDGSLREKLNRLERTLIS